MIKTEIKSDDKLEHRIVRQLPSCQVSALDTNIIVKIYKKNKWVSDAFATSEINLCEFDSRETLPQEKTIYPSLQPLNGWISYIKDQFYSEAGTNSVYYSINDKDVDIWVLIPAHDFTLLRHLVDIEMKILNTLSYGNETRYRLEFHILYQNNSDDSTIVPREAIRLSK